MTDYVWPADLVPFAQSFYLQPHTGGTESPFSRVTKTYGLSAPRWICTMGFRGGYWGTDGIEAIGPRLDALIAKLKGRQNRIAIYDFRRPAMRTPGWTGAGNLTAALNATSMTVTGLQPGAVLYAGDYIGGDGRPHIILDTVQADSSGQAVVSIQPQLKALIGANTATFGNPTALFKLTDDDAGDNGVTAGEAVSVTLKFVEDIS